MTKKDEDIATMIDFVVHARNLLKDSTITTNHDAIIRLMAQVMLTGWVFLGTGCCCLVGTSLCFVFSIPWAVGGNTLVGLCTTIGFLSCGWYGYTELELLEKAFQQAPK